MGNIRHRLMLCVLLAAALWSAVFSSALHAEEELPMLESAALARPATIVIDRPIQSQRQILGNQPQRTRPLRVAQQRQARPPAPLVSSCKGQELDKLKHSSARGIEKAWQDTEAGRWGYGFQDRNEYQKWQAAFDTVFTETASACKIALACNQRHGKNAVRRCNNLNWQYAGWKKASEEFAAKVRQMDHGQAPQLCSLSPNAGDLSDCFDRLAERITEDCRGNHCRTISQCWRNVSFLDEAIRQAESACRFSGQELAQCRGWQDATARRQQTFNRCETMYRNAGLNLQPVL